MLVIISDLHLTDGTSGETIGSHAFKIFRERIRNLAYEASWRSNGKYVPLKELDIILLGDVLDVIRSQKWIETDLRPWDDSTNEDFIKVVAQINEDILGNEKNVESFKVLRGMSLKNEITLPPATAYGKPAKVGHHYQADQRIPVSVKIHYMVGNHDWFYHLPGKGYNEIRKKVVETLGLANEPNLPFSHDPAESKELSNVLKAHKVFARHGDIFDAFNYENDRNQSSLGDAIVVELLNRFPTAVEKEFGHQLPKECTNGLKEIDNVRPHLMIPFWIEGLLQRTCSSQESKKNVKKVWNDLADKFLELDFVKERDQNFKWDNVDALQAGLKISQLTSFEKINSIIMKVKKLLQGEESYFKDAMKENEFKNREAKFIVYGHTHGYELVPLDCNSANGSDFNQMYINSGTWRTVHQLSQANPEAKKFISYKVMTYLAFFKNDERAGRDFEVWTGQLG